ncbi:MAG: hypothetical protein ABGX16_00375, partial [Pirellulales bacterium]
MINQFASGHWPQIHADLTTLDPAILAGGDYRCPECGGDDRFNVCRKSYTKTGKVFCKSPCKLHCQSGLFVVEKMGNVSFPEVCFLTGEWLIRAGACTSADLIKQQPGKNTNETERCTASSPPPSTAGKKKSSRLPPRRFNLPAPVTKGKGENKPLRVHKSLTSAVRGAIWHYHDKKKVLDCWRPPSNSFTYEYSPGEIAFIVLRWNLTPKESEAAKKKKIFSQIMRVEGNRWQSKNQVNLKPLFGLYYGGREDAKALPDEAGEEKFPDVLDVADAQTVFVCEGEPAAEALMAIGLTAVCSVQGSGSPGKTDWRPLNRKDIVFVPDADMNGEKYVCACRGQISIDAPDATVKVVCLSDDPDFTAVIKAGDDAVDWSQFHKDKGRSAEWLREKLQSLPDRKDKECFAPKVPRSANKSKPAAKVDDAAPDDNDQPAFTSDIDQAQPNRDRGADDGF